jgi:hypothetical protein
LHREFAVGASRSSSEPPETIAERSSKIKSQKELLILHPIARKTAPLRRQILKTNVFPAFAETEADALALVHPGLPTLDWVSGI